MSISVKQSDSRPVLVYQLVDASSGSNVPLNLTNATSVTMKVRTQKTTGAPTFSVVGVVTSAVNGQVQFTLSSANLAVAGSYDVEFEIIWNDAGVQTVPNDSYMTLIIVNDLDH